MILKKRLKIIVKFTMDYKPENLPPNQIKIKTETMKVPVVLFSSGKTALKKETVELVKKLAENPKIFSHIAVLSDAHPKPGIINPTGSVVASEKNIIPEVLDAAPNCGMRVILTDLTEQNLTGENINRLFEELRQSIPSKKLIGTPVSFQKVLEIFKNGSLALKNIFDLRVKNEFENTYKNGNFFSDGKVPAEKDILQAIPESIVRIAKYRLGLLGATKSHFLSLMRVVSVENSELAERLGLKEGQYVFFMHTGSSIVGRYTASLYTSRKIKSLAQKIILSLIRLATAKIKPENLENTFCAVSNYGFANRTLITHKLDKTLEKVFGRQINLALLYDAPHVYFDREEHFGKSVWVHRNGANRAYGPQKMSGHPLFAETGEPVLIAPFADGVGYIGVGTDENRDTFFSANHEIGKINNSDVQPDRFEKYADGIIKEMEENKIINLVAKLETIKTLTY